MTDAKGTKNFVLKLQSRRDELTIVRLSVGIQPPREDQRALLAHARVGESGCAGPVPAPRGLGARALFGTRVSRRFVLGGALGLAGIALIFWPEFVRAAGHQLRGARRVARAARQFHDRHGLAQKESACSSTDGSGNTDPAKTTIAKKAPAKNQHILLFIVLSPF